ncbi:hypothetical protein HGM15179_013040, partial [Zosterops borbonicus]
VLEVKPTEGGGTCPRTCCVSANFVYQRDKKSQHLKERGSKDSPSCNNSSATGVS